MITSMNWSTVAGFVSGCLSAQPNQGAEKLRTVFVSHEDFAIQDLVVAQDVVQHLLVKQLRRRGKCDLHAAGLLGLQIDVGRFLVQPNAYSFQLSLKECSLLCSLGSVQNHDNHVARLLPSVPGSKR